MSEESGPEARPAEEVGGSALSVSGTASAWDPAAGSERGGGWPEHGTRLPGASAAEGGPSTLPRAWARSSRRAVRGGQARSRRGVCPARVQPSKGSLSLGAAERSAGEGRRVHSGRGPDSEQAWGSVLAKGALGLALPLCVVKQAWIWTIKIKWRSPCKAVWQRPCSAGGAPATGSWACVGRQAHNTASRLMVRLAFRRARGVRRHRGRSLRHASVVAGRRAGAAVGPSPAVATVVKMVGAEPFVALA